MSHWCRYGGNDCRVHLAVLANTLIAYPIQMPPPARPVKFTLDFEVLTERIEFVKVHCGPAGTLPARWLPTAVVRSITVTGVIPLAAADPQVREVLRQRLLEDYPELSGAMLHEVIMPDANAKDPWASIVWKVW